MKPLEAIDWQHLSGPFGIDATLPEAIAALQASYSHELLDDIIWERIYHQNTLYENSFAAIPYLVSIAAAATDPAIQENILSSLAVLICEDGNEPVPDTIPAEFHGNKEISPTQARDIFNEYLASLKQLPALCAALVPYVSKQEDDEGKTYFLAAIAVAHGHRQFARLLTCYVTGEEYMSVCPSCDNEVHIWPKGDKLVVFEDDPVFKKGQQPIPIQPAIPQEGTTETNIRSFGWHYAQALQIGSLKKHWPYLTGAYTCPSCGEPTDVYESMENGL